MSNRFQWFLLLFFAIFLTGCAHVISKDLRLSADPSLTFGQVHQNSNAYKGKMVVWGGEIVETVNQKDGATQIEVIQSPLDWRGEPKGTHLSAGRFLVLVNEYLDPYVYRKGRKITVAGEILGEKTKPLGEMEYRYPVLSSKQIYLWPEYYHYPYSYYYYDPWWYYPYYPRWGWGMGFHYHYHR